jgi:GNAT superfamily N-acetyltransferase
MNENKQAVFETNEAKWWSFWAKLEDVGAGYVLYSDDFEEPLFNHLGFIHPESGDLSQIRDSIVRSWSLLKRPSAIISNTADFDVHRKLMENEGYRSTDSLEVMELVRPDMLKSSDFSVNKTGEARLDKWTLAYLDAFYGSRALMEPVRRAVQVAYRADHTTFYHVEVDEQFAGVTASFVFGDVTGIYCVGTVPQFRRRGVASSMLAQVLHDSQGSGSVLVLQTFGSDRVVEFYEKLGFRSAYSKTVFQK